MEDKMSQSRHYIEAPYILGDEKRPDARDSHGSVDTARSPVTPDSSSRVMMFFLNHLDRIPVGQMTLNMPLRKLTGHEDIAVPSIIERQLHAWIEDIRRYGLGNDGVSEKIEHIERAQERAGQCVALRSVGSTERVYFGRRMARWI